MNRDRIRRFFHQSREWSRATRGRELFRRAASDLAECAGIDSGFFVYRRRVFIEEATPQRARVYEPWGRFTDGEEDLQNLVDDVITRLPIWEPLQERWLTMEAASERLQHQWAQYGIRSFGIWPLMSREQRLGALVAARTPDGEDIDEATTTAVLDGCAAQLALALDLILATRIAEDASHRDSLTGLWNRRGLEARWETLIQTAHKHRRSVLVGLIDLDNLKIINDTQGHPAGDAALRRVAQILMQQVRDQDLVVRWGGDEFVVVTQSAEMQSGVLFRLQEAVRTQAPGLSVSIGSAVCGIDGMTWDHCYTVADRKLYEAKRKRGANRAGLRQV